MRNSHSLGLLSALLPLSGLACGLTGGSVPIGDPGKRSITGTVLLPNQRPDNGAAVSIHILPSPRAAVTTFTDVHGTFVASDLPADRDLEVVVNGPAGKTLKAVIPRLQSGVSAPGQGAAAPGQGIIPPGQGSLAVLFEDIGSVTATTTVAATAVEKEVSRMPGAEDTIVATQLPALTSAVAGTSQSKNQEEGELNDPGQMAAAVQAAVTTAANTELIVLAAQKDPVSAQAALTGLLGYLNVTQGRNLRLTSDQQARLIDRQTRGPNFTPGTIAAALHAAGVISANDATVQAASDRQRSLLPGFVGFGPGISPFEALAIAVSPSGSGGFQGSQATLNNFLKNLL